LKRTVFVLALLWCAISLAAQTQKSPTRAVLYSALVPGGGQIYNETYVKAGIVIGVQAYFVTNAIYHDAKAQDYKDKVNSTTDALLLQEYKDKRKEYQELRTSDFWWIGITAALSMLDAYVEAQLFDFEAQKDKLHLRFEGDTLLLEKRF